MAEPFLGEIQMFAGNFAPRGYSTCNGQIILISQNQALFSLLGTTYGGDGRTTFGLPNLNGRVAIHPGNGPGLNNVNWGENLGTDTHVLTAAHIPAHTHGIGAVSLPTSDADATLKTAINNFPAKPAEFAYGNSVDAKTSINTPTVTGATGNSISVNNRKPSQELLFIIALTGIFPPRS